ncbi:hypothetical protein [Pseudacidovorax sp. RU35E]|uniref:hypothetical protein n=1 Tax=Pseudacidovorax sp. RU35E TaxID=1907403 RepID=UPI000954A319|nr:hypothetical protein [Pseudacidovorax sp. RU35E]SIR30801.1 hypothetical protein SAMN05880557_109213 [Pseudacidovorax sp. RU35E]
MGPRRTSITVTKLIRTLAAAVLLLVLFATPALAAGPVVIATLVEGEAHLLREGGRFALAPGVVLQAGDLVQTAADARLLRLEYADGPVVDLGPASRAMVEARLGTGGRAPAGRLYLLQGWVKLGAAPSSRAVTSLLTPDLALTGEGGSVVVQVAPSRTQVFAESGKARVQARTVRGQEPVELATGRLLDAEGWTERARPDAAFVRAVPPSFLDPLPLRAARFKDRPVEAERVDDLRYEDVAAWLQAEPALRARFAERWRGLAKKPAFRAALVANMNRHPEWDRVVFPEKYVKPRSQPAPALRSAPPPAAPTVPPVPGRSAY